MKILGRGLILATTLGTAFSPARHLTMNVASSSVTQVGQLLSKAAGSRYKTSQLESYLSEDQVGYIRPGLHVKVNSVTIPADRRPVVDISLTDDFDQPLDRAGKVTPGAISVSFILAWWDPVLRQYTSYTTRSATSLPTSPIQATVLQAGTDSAGAAGFTDLALGHATYRFKTVLPANFDQTKTTTLGLYASRNLTDILNKTYYSNFEFDFRPDGAAVTDVWDMTNNATCNNCHNPLSAHGGSRRDVKLCVLCHSPQSVNPDTGNTVDFKVLIHKIHDGNQLPSVVAGTPYQIINSHGVSNFSTVVFPQDIRNCTKCHSASATQAPNYYTYPSAAACGSCHDNVNFATGENHAGGIQVDDSACASCHVPQGDTEFDASILGAHTIPLKSTQLAGLNAEILSVTNTQPGQNPTVTFKITNDDGTVVDPKTLGSNVNVVIGGPSVEYSLAAPFRERADGASFDGTIATYTLHAALPQTASGTWLASMEVRRTVNINGGTNADGSPKSISVTEGADNPIFYFGVTDATPVYRRTVVKKELCNVCHDKLSLHGGQRFIIRECVACHNPNANDSARRPANEGSPEAISFSRLIHRIHRGENLTKDFTVFAFGGTPDTFNEVRFPGDLRDCEKCHVNQTGTSDGGSEQLPLPLTNLPVQTPPPPQEWYTPQQTTAAACLGCHDTREAAAHAYVNTAPFGEACASCHAPEDEFAVNKVHAR